MASRRWQLCDEVDEAVDCLVGVADVLDYFGRGNGEKAADPDTQSFITYGAALTVRQVSKTLRQHHSFTTYPSGQAVGEGGIRKGQKGQGVALGPLSAPITGPSAPQNRRSREDLTPSPDRVVVDCAPHRLRTYRDSRALPPRSCCPYSCAYPRPVCARLPLSLGCRFSHQEVADGHLYGHP